MVVRNAQLLYIRKKKFYTKNVLNLFIPQNSNVQLTMTTLKILVFYFVCITAQLVTCVLYHTELFVLVFAVTDFLVCLFTVIVEKAIGSPSDCCILTSLASEKAPQSFIAGLVFAVQFKSDIVRADCILIFVLACFQNLVSHSFTRAKNKTPAASTYEVIDL